MPSLRRRVNFAHLTTPNNFIENRYDDRELKYKLLKETIKSCNSLDTNQSGYPDFSSGLRFCHSSHESSATNDQPIPLLSYSIGCIHTSSFFSLYLQAGSTSISRNCCFTSRSRKERRAGRMERVFLKLLEVALTLESCLSISHHLPKHKKEGGVFLRWWGAKVEGRQLEYTIISIFLRISKHVLIGTIPKTQILKWMLGVGAYLYKH